MKIVNAGYFPFCYQAGDQDPGLFVKAFVYETTTGAAVLLGSVILQESDYGMYSGIYTAESGKTYLVIAICFIDGGYTVVDTDRSPWAENYKVIDVPPQKMLMNYGAFDMAEDLFVAMNIYRYVSGVPTLVNRTALVHVFAGVYFAQYSGLRENSYVVSTSCYTDRYYTTVDSNRPSGSDCLETLVPAIIFTGDAVLEGQGLEAILEATC